MAANIVCVLKSGGDFKPEHVERLADQVAGFTTVEYDFWCMTDYPPMSFNPDIKVVSLKRGWPGWWSKLELFDHFSDAFYMDLDTTVVGCLDPLLQPKDGFYALLDFDQKHRRGKLASGVMRWRGDYSFLTTRFAMRPDDFIARYRTAERWGDQGYIGDMLVDIEGMDWGALQEERPGAIESYKLGQQTRETVLVCHHGKPRPWEV